MNIKISSAEKQHILEMHKRSNRTFISEQEPESSDTSFFSQLNSKLQEFLKKNNLQNSFKKATDDRVNKVIIGNDTISVGDLDTYESKKNDTTTCKEEPTKHTYCGVLNKVSRHLNAVK
jgi:hypothetical protein